MSGIWGSRNSAPEPVICTRDSWNRWCFPDLSGNWKGYTGERKSRVKKEEGSSGEKNAGAFSHQCGESLESVKPALWGYFGDKDKLRILCGSEK